MPSSVPLSISVICLPTEPPELLSATDYWYIVALTSGRSSPMGDSGYDGARGRIRLRSDRSALTPRLGPPPSSPEGPGGHRQSPSPCPSCSLTCESRPPRA